jgi:hypothetical protein
MTYLRSCKSCNSEEAKPPNSRYQVQPGNEILEPLALVEMVQELTYDKSIYQQNVQ